MTKNSTQIVYQISVHNHTINKTRHFSLSCGLTCLLWQAVALWWLLYQSVIS